MPKPFFFIIAVLGCCTNFVWSQVPDISSKEKFDAINRNVSVRDSAGKKIVHLDTADAAGIAWLTKFRFTKGTIEFDVKGKDVAQQSFVGLAFHGISDSVYEAIYFRPFNFLEKDTTRRNHSVQYICMPRYDWSYLRETYPGKYEQSLSKTTQPTNWFHVKIMVADSSISVYVNDDDKPSLLVQPLAHNSEGRIGFWVGNGSDGDFSNLAIQRSK